MKRTLTIGDQVTIYGCSITGKATHKKIGRIIEFLDSGFVVVETERNPILGLADRHTVHRRQCVKIRKQMTFYIHKHNLDKFGLNEDQFKACSEEYQKMCLKFTGVEK